MYDLDSPLIEVLRGRKHKALYRQRAVVQSPQGVSLTKNGKTLLSFCSNDYLGLANHPQVIAAFTKAAEKFGVGSGASHLVNGHSLEHQALEEELANFVARDRAILFSTGYMANLGVINTLTSKGDAVLEDKLNHASLLDGGLLSRAKLLRYRHNDVSHLQRQIENSRFKRKLIVVDGVFSMDGDFADLPAIVTCAQKQDACIMVDDAHGFGVVGQRGAGVVEHFKLSQREVPVLVGTLGKAFGTFGAFVAGSEALIETLIQFARTYMYTTALPPAVAAATRAGLRIIAGEPERRAHLQTLIARFRQGCETLNCELLPSSTPIQPLVIGNAERALSVSEKLEQKGFWLTAIRPPTVPQESARLRVTLSAGHRTDQVDALLVALAEVIGER